MMNQNDSVFEAVKSRLQAAEHVVCITGLATVVEAGGMDIWSRDELYRIEKKYGESPEELMSAGVFYSRKEHFYEFYRNEILRGMPQPGATIWALKQLQSMGKLDAVISMNIFGLERLAGLSNVLEIQGSVYNGYCPMCRKQVSYQEILQSKGVPFCESCNIPIRPGIRLFGERVRNDIYTSAANACRNADVLLVLGANLNGEKMQFIAGHYQGDGLILINSEPHRTDKYANYVIHNAADRVMSHLLAEIR